MKPLTKPMRGFYFWIGSRVLVHLNFAKSFTWGRYVEVGSKIETFYIKLSKIENVNGDKVYSLVLFPIKIIIGVSSGKY